MAANALDEVKYVSKIAKLLIACQSRFSEFAGQADNVVLFNKPFNYPEEKINCLYRREFATRNYRYEVLLGFGYIVKLQSFLSYSGRITRK